MVVDSAEEVANEVAASLLEHGLAAKDEGIEEVRAPTICLTDRSLHFLELGEKILDLPLNEVEYVDLG